MASPENLAYELSLLGLGLEEWLSFGFLANVYLLAFYSHFTFSIEGGTGFYNQFV